MSNKQKLGNFIKLQGGYAFKSSDFSEQGVPIVRISNIRNNKLDFSDAAFYNNQIKNNLSDYLIEEDDVLIAMSGATTGKVGIASKDNLPAIVNQRVGRFVIQDKEKLSQKFLRYLVQSSDFINQVNIHAIGGAQPNISATQIESISLYIPQLIKEQQKIAEILSSVDAAIEKTEQVIAKTKEVKKGLIQQLLIKGIGHKEFKQTEIGEIPVEWEICSLEEISIIKGEYGIGASATEYNPSKPRYLRITDIDDYGYLSDKDIRGFDEEEYEKYLLKLGDLVFARTGNTTGKTYMYRSGDGDLVYAGFLIRFRFDPELCNVAFINYLTQTKYYSDWVNVNSQRSGQPGINSNQYCKFKVALPSISEQMKIVSILDKVEEKIKIERNKLEKYAYLKQGLMQQLLTGQVRVKID